MSDSDHTRQLANAREMGAVITRLDEGEKRMGRIEHDVTGIRMEQGEQGRTLAEIKTMLGDVLDDRRTERRAGIVARVFKAMGLTAVGAGIVWVATGGGAKAGEPKEPASVESQGEPKP